MHYAAPTYIRAICRHSFRVGLCSRDSLFCKRRGSSVDVRYNHDKRRGRRLRGPESKKNQFLSLWRGSLFGGVYHLLSPWFAAEKV